MKNCKCMFYLTMGIGIGLLYKEYEREIMKACNKMVKKEKELIKDGLNL